MINTFDAEEAIQELANRIPEESELMIGTMVDANAFAPNAYVAKHAEWREVGGVPRFRATIQYTNGDPAPLVGGDYIEVEVCGMFTESRTRLRVADFSVERCDVIDTHADRVVEH